MHEIPSNGVCWSWLHRWTRRVPGTLPKWFLSSSGCGADDAISWLTFGIVLSLVGTVAVIAIRFGGIDKRIFGYMTAGFIAALIVLSVAVEYYFIEPCRTAERKAIATARRARANPPVNSPAPNTDATSEVA
jgi:hypothetical protein